MFAWVIRLVSAFRRLRLWKRVAIVAALAVIVPYLGLWLSFWVGPGRWLWNYTISWHPALRHVVPPGPWGPLSGDPIWIEQIYESPHMSTWDIPELTSPKYRAEEPHSSHIVGPPTYTSPSLLKLHVFSTIRNVSRPKRDVIRRLSPIYTIPAHLRHLVEVKFVLGKPKHSNGQIDEERQKEFEDEQAEFGDLFQLDLKNGENLREGKILDWIRAVGDGEDGGRESLWLFKMDDDTILNMPKFLDVLVSLDARIPHYLGTSLNRWPPYHHHFTGMLTGFSWGVVKTLATGIGKLSRPSIEWPRDDDVLTGEIMASLPSGPHCHTKELQGTPLCDPRTPPEWGWTSPPWNDPRTGLIRYDFYRRLGNHEVWFLKCDVAIHGGIYKSPEGWEKGWKSRVAGLHWTPPPSFKQYEEHKRLAGERDSDVEPDSLNYAQ